MALQWKLTLDEPYAIASEPGFTKAVHCRNFRPKPESFSQTYRDPLTGLLMLQPSFHARDWHDQARALTSFRYESDFWQRSKRSADMIETFTNVKPATSGFLLIELVVAVAIAAIRNWIGYAADKLDDLRWVLESQWTLKSDEGFAIYMSNLDDELIRKRHWLYIQWDRIGLHIGQGGVCRVYQYPLGDLASDPTQVDEFVLCPPSEFSGRGSWFVFLPIPYYGLAVYHSAAPPKSAQLWGSAESGPARGHLIPWPTWNDIDGYAHLFDASPLRIAINPYQKYHFALSTLQYPSSGIYVDAPFDPGWNPSTGPTLERPILLPVPEQGVTASLIKAAATGDWEAGVDRKGRAAVVLQTSDTARTPFVQGYGFGWDPVIETRDTTAVTPDVQQLQITEDADGRIEGTATMMLKTAAEQLMGERGDATWKLEYSDDEGVTWTTYSAGLATDWSLQMKSDAFGMWYQARCKLVDMMERMREGHVMHLETAFDGMTVGDSLNTVLQCAGFSSVTVPEPLNSRKVQIAKDGDTWRYAVRATDDGEEVIQKLLVLGRRQHREWLAVFDADAWVWTIVQKPRDMVDKWQLTPLSANHDPAGQVLRIQSCELTVLPPECNILRVQGADKPSPDGTKSTVYATNPDSLTNPDSPDYLGRCVIISHVCPEGMDEFELRSLARKVEVRAMHRSVRANVTMPEFTPGLGCNRLVELLDADGNVMETLWTKRRTITINPGYQGWRDEVAYELDSIWEGGPP